MNMQAGGFYGEFVEASSLSSGRQQFPPGARASRKWPRLDAQEGGMGSKSRLGTVSRGVSGSCCLADPDRNRRLGLGETTCEEQRHPHRRTECQATSCPSTPRHLRRVHESAGSRFGRPRGVRRMRAANRAAQSGRFRPNCAYRSTSVTSGWLALSSTHISA